jgi:hypothetical protein
VKTVRDGGEGGGKEVRRPLRGDRQLPQLFYFSKLVRAIELKDGRPTTALACHEGSLLRYLLHGTSFTWVITHPIQALSA